MHKSTNTYNYLSVLFCGFSVIKNNVMKTQNTFNLYITLLIGLLFIIYPSLSKAQVSPAIYFSGTTSLTSHYNPAFTCKADFFLGFPFLANTNLDVRNSWKYSDYVVRENDSLWISPAKLVNSLNEINYSMETLNNDIVYVGFRKGKNYFRFGISNRFSSITTYSDKTAALIFTGNAQFIGKTTTFKDNFLLTNMYQEYYISYTRTIGNKFSIGITPKFLTGVFNSYTENANFDLTIDEANYNHLVRSNFNIHTSSPLPDFNKFADRLKQLPWVQFSSNTGYAIDLGISYALNKNIQFAASLIDFGKIHWDKNVKNFTSNSSEAVPFEGLDLGSLFDSKKYTGATASEMMTGLSESFGLKETTIAYTAPLSSKLLFSGSYIYKEKNKIGMLTYSEHINDKWLNTYSVNISRQFGKWLLASVNYNNGKYSPESFGISLELQTDELHVIIATNNIYGFLNPHNTKGYNLQFGIGWQLNKGDRAKYKKAPKESEEN